MVAMSYLLFPGRHLLNTRFQEQYLHQVLTATSGSLPGLKPGQAVPKEPITQIIFAITLRPTRPIPGIIPFPFTFARSGWTALRAAWRLRFLFPFLAFLITGTPRPSPIFTIKEIADQSEGLIRLAPSNCLVLCSTPAVIELYQKLGYSILTAEQTRAGCADPDRPCA